MAGREREREREGLRAGGKEGRALCRAAALTCRSYEN